MRLERGKPNSSGSASIKILSRTPRHRNAVDLLYKESFFLGLMDELSFQDGYETVKTGFVDPGLDIRND